MNTNLYVELSTNDQRCQRVGCILPGLHVPAEQRLLKWKWSEITYSQVWWPILIIRALHYPSKCTHTAVNTHTHIVNTHPEQWAAIYAAGAQGAVGGSVPCSRAPRRGYWMWRDRCTFTPPHRQSLPDQDSNSQPFDYESESLPLGHNFPCQW